MSSQGQEDTSNSVDDNASLSEYSFQVREGFSIHKRASDVPDIPSIPANLMVPPSSVNTSTTSTVTTGGRQMTINISQETGTSYDNKETSQDVGEIHQNLDSIHSHVIREADVLQNLQSQLSIKAHEMDRLRDEINQYERGHEREALQMGQVSGHGTTVPGHGTAVTQPSDLSSGFSRTVALSTQGSCTSDTDLVIREYKSKIEDLNTKLRMTTELCAKQDSYYRDVIKELEDRLTETINGRDHILTLRDKEAANQMNVMRQLEAALRKQEHLDSEKEKAIASLEEKLIYIEGCHSQSLSIIDKVKHIVNEEEIKRGRIGIIHGQDTRNTEITSFAADLIIQTLQKWLSEDHNEKQILNTKLQKVMREHQDAEKELTTKNEQLKQEYESKLNTLNKEHAHELDNTTSHCDKMNQELETLREKLDSIKKEHEAEVSSLVDQTKVLHLKVAKVEEERNDVIRECEKKCIDFQNTNNDAKAELKVLREEIEKVLLSLSQEQASSITLKEKLATADAENRAGKERLLRISEKNDFKENELKNELEKLRTELDEYKTLLIQREKEYHEQAEKGIEKATKDEQGKANDRLNIMLFELNKVNNGTEQLKTELENKNQDLNRVEEENNKMRYNLEKREEEVALLREEKLQLAGKHQHHVKEAVQLQNDLHAKEEYYDNIAQELDKAHTLIGKLKTQLEEREKTIASFRDQGTNLAEILQRNNVASDSLQREREELVKKVEELVVEVQEMKKHREILAKKLKAKDKRLKEMEEENTNLQKTLNLRNEELAAWTDERENVHAELKARRLEAVILREERDSLGNLLQGQDGEREKEIGKLISRLKGSEQDLSLTKKLLKSKGEMSGKAVRVAETMQRQVTEKRGEMDTLLNKIHWLQENLNAAVKDKMYYESKSSRLSEEVQEVVIARDQLRFDVHETREECTAYQKQVGHLEQALEKAALKFADCQGVIEKLEQELARMKLKHSLELKEQERNLKAGSTLSKVDAASIAEVLARVNAGLRLPMVSSQTRPGNTTISQKTPVIAQPITLQNLPTKTPQSQTPETHLKDSEVQQDLKCLLQDVRTLISSFQAHLTQSTITPRALPNTGHDLIGTKHGTEVGKRLRNSEPRHLKGHYPVVDPGNPRSGAGCRDSDQDTIRLIDYDSESEFEGSFDLDTEEYLEHMRPPLRSSSPKPEILNSLATAQDSYICDLPIRDHGERDQLNDSDVTSLLSFATAVSGDTLTNQVSQEDISVKINAPLGRSGQCYSVSTKPKKSNKENIERRRTGSRKSHTKASTRKDASPPSYERAEMMLRSLAQTGNHLTKKNKEISRLLNEQDRRIKQCRDNEQGINNLLS